MIRRTKLHTFFFRPDAPFSQWHPARFEVDGVPFACAEQYMMYGKAVLFADAEAAARILAAGSPRQQKAIGRQVRGFDEARWRAARMDIVRTGSLAKFGQNPALRAALLETAPTTLVEASPFDRVWGIGLSADDPRADDPSRWRGQNLLGQILTEVRAAL
ncbi:MAG: NADAR family protein [Kofleriaceae bacterium]|nr:NADAR family protein [Kofleriaceae bacterium]MBP9205836.1 NADAR family protein [Kofleriaceae bacterium]